MIASSEPAALVLPFGKHKGSTVAEVLAKDPGYAEWLAAQGWLAERFAELHAAIATRGAGTDDTPEHNAMQVRFLDPLYRMACVLAARPKLKAFNHAEERSWAVSETKRLMDQLTWRATSPRPIENGDLEQVEADLDNATARHEAALLAEWRFASQVAFEQSGVDVLIGWRSANQRPDASERAYRSPDGCISVELKPTMGDDFPSVLRQMQRIRASVLVLGSYSGRAVSEPQLREMFSANGYTLLFERDIEAEIPGARALCWA
jgi:uncharacterized protein (DUF3820 family)